MQEKFIHHHQQHQTWNRQLDFYQEEIAIFTKELTHIMGVHAKSFSVIEHAEEYKKIFAKKLENIKALKMEIHEMEKIIATHPEGNADEHWDHQEMTLKMKDFLDEMESMKNSFRRFTSKHLR